MTIATTNSMPMRNPRPAPRCKSALSGSGMGLPLRLARALSSRPRSRARGSGGPLSLMSGSAIPLIPADMAGTARTIIRHPQSVNLRSEWRGQRFLSRLQRGKARWTSLCGLPQLVSAGEIDGDELRDAALGHRHAVQPLHARHRDAMMRDEQKARAGRIGGLGDDAAEAVDIGIVERRIDLVEDADRRRVGQEHGEDQCDRGQCLLAPRQQREVLQTLPGRARQDVEAAVERVAIADPGKLGLAAAEQALEQLAEMAVELIECREQPTTPFLVQRADALPQPRNRGGQILALALQALEAGLRVGPPWPGGELYRAHVLP